LTVDDFIDIDFSIPVFNKWDANEHLRKLVEVDGEDKSGGEHVNFVYNIGIEKKASSFCVDSTISVIHSDGFESDKRQLYQRLL
jgi:hypothetical protein